MGRRGRDRQAGGKTDRLTDRQRERERKLENFNTRG